MSTVTLPRQFNQRRVVDLSSRPRQRPTLPQVGLSAGQVRHRAGRDPLVQLIPVRPDLAGLGRHRPRRAKVSTLRYGLTAAAFQLDRASAWERTHHERLVEDARCALHVAVLLLLAAGLLYVGVRSA